MSQLGLPCNHTRAHRVLNDRYPVLETVLLVPISVWHLQDEVALLKGQEGAVSAVIENGYSVMSDWFFQMVFLATTASIVSGALAERGKL